MEDETKDKQKYAAYYELLYWRRCEPACPTSYASVPQVFMS
jgi:hypothetical protein